MGRASKRDLVLDTAEDLFSRQGFAATGINQITREAGVASMTLYNNFENKDALVAATLERRSIRLLDRVLATVEKSGTDPRARVLAVFDAVDQWVAGELASPGGFSGCIFLKAAQEYEGPSSPARRVALDHKQRIIGFFEQEARRLEVSDPAAIAKSLHLLIDGAVTQAQLFADGESVRRAKDLAELIVDRG
ncbi:TetR/AcrR family transcriptional regulator [Algihabitans albus]|uniref:TetR/AcrR family transcriptional regulator n=1 Tax=Algihabitans albus TaxID=2164067 RepID=UPI000E5CFBD5|nr:TetR/AcrR family transcriptional regulator [Algihabitans albus]